MSLADLTTATPVEIDTELERLYGESVLLRMQSERATDSVYSHANAKRIGYGRHQHWNMTRDEAIAKVEDLAENGQPWERRDAQRALDRLADARVAVVANREKQRPLHEEYNRRPWTRAFLVVTNGKGHVHSSMSCSTCYETTQYAWLPQMSGKDEAEIVEAAGADACTVCYPSAPVESLSRPRSVFSAEEKKTAEEKAQRAAELAAKRAQADAAKVVDPVTGEVLFKTERGATNRIAYLLQDLCWYGTSHPSSDKWLVEVATIRAALEAKGVAYDYDKALANARKKCGRDTARY